MKHKLSSLLIAVIIMLFFKSEAFAANSSIFTAELWVKPETSVASKALVGKAEEMRVFTDASGLVGCQIKATTWAAAAQATTTSLVNGQWSFVSCTYDKITLRVYVNGVQVGSTALTSAADDTAAALKVGQDDSADLAYANFTGTTDNFQFYNYARSAKQITEDMLGDHVAVSAGGGKAAVIASGTKQSAPLAWYKFSEGYGTTANNSGSAGSTLNGTLTNMSSPATATSGWTNSGKLGKGLNFVTDDWVDLGTGLDQNGEVTVSAWMNATTNGKYILANCDVGGSLQDYALSINSSGKISALWGNTTILTSNTTLSTSTWYHVVLVRSGTTSAWTAKIYLNGKLDGSAATAVNPNATNERTAIGRLGNLALGYFAGSIDEVKIYNYALTQDEINADFNQSSALVLGSRSTESDGKTASQSEQRGYCVPGDTTSCTPPVAEWNFEEGTGTTANDSSGNANTGTLGVGSSAPQWTTGKKGKGLRFDGNDYATKATFSPLTGGGSMTVEAWIKPNSLSGTQHIISQNGPFFFSLTGNKLGNATYLIYTGTWTGILGNYTLSTGQWYHVAMTYDGINIKLFVNGVLDNYAPKTGTLVGTGCLQIGAGDSGACNTRSSYFDGLIDQVRVFNYARTAAQIAWDYNQGKPVAYWDFDECTGTTLHSLNETLNTALNATLSLGAGAQTAAGTCSDGLTTSAWWNGRDGKYNASLNFDGSDDSASVAGTVAYARAVSFWAKPTSTTQRLVQLSASDSVEISGGTVVVTGFGTETVYVDGKAGTSFPDTNWHLVTVVSDADLTANLIKFGLVGATYYSGQLDDVSVFNYALTGAQVKLLYNQDSAVRFGPLTGNP